jgi:hypothetical protein
VSAESHMALFDRAADQLVAAKVLLPGASVLWRLVGTVRQRAQERSWSLIAGGLTGEEHRRLLTLLTVPADATETGLERLRWGPVKPTADGIVGTLLRLRELRALSPALTGIAELPVARLRALLVDARAVRSQQIAQMTELRRQPFPNAAPKRRLATGYSSSARRREYSTSERVPHGPCGAVRGVRHGPL